MIIWPTIVRLVKQAWNLPQTAMLAFKKSPRQTVPNDDEVERLDRLRNPSKYQGK